VCRDDLTWSNDYLSITGCGIDKSKVITYGNCGDQGQSKEVDLEDFGLQIL